MEMPSGKKYYSICLHSSKPNCNGSFWITVWASGLLDFEGDCQTNWASLVRRNESGEQDLAG